MAFTDRMKEARLAAGMTQEKLAQAIGVAKSTYTGYEKGNSEPNILIQSRIMEALGIDANFLFQDEINLMRSAATPWEMEHIIKKYRSLDGPGQEAVDAILDCEHRRVEKAKEERAAAAPAKPMKVIPLLGTSFAAGTTEQESDIPWEDLEVDADSKAEFAIHINGNSMEPYLPDGSIAYGVKRTPRDGEVAALLLDGDFICKQVCQDMVGNLYLFALNRDRKDADQQIMRDAERSVTCFGTILMDPVPLPTEI